MHPQHLGDGELAVDGALLEHDPDALAQRALAGGGIESEDADVAAGARPVALEDLGGGRLARAVGSQQAEDLAGRDAERDPPHGLEVAVGAAQVADVDGEFHDATIVVAPQPAR